MAAAQTGGRLGLRTLLLEKDVFGGSVAVLEAISEYPGIERINGWELTQTMVKQAREAGSSLADSMDILAVEESPGGNFVVDTGDAGRLHARSVIVCTGGQPRMLGLVDEEHFAQHGVHTCVQCAGARYADQAVAIAGNSSWAMRAADHLLNLGCTVSYVTGDHQLSGDATIGQNLLENDRFRFLGGCHITGLYGNEYLDEILLTSLDSGNFRKIRVSAIFVYRGIKPNSSLVAARRDRHGFLQVDENFMTSVSGMFAAGRIIQDDLPIHVMIGDGSRAALAAATWLAARS